MKIGIAVAGQAEIEAIRSALALEPRHVVTWLARSADDAITMCAQELPDLVLMDLFIDDLGGREATRRIMAATPCAILIMTGNSATHAAEVFEAMGHGALDAIDMPTLKGANGRGPISPFLIKVNAIEQRLRDRFEPAQLRPESPQAPVRRPVAADRLVAIGASAGGPAAIRTLLRGLPGDFPAAVVVVQHMDERFTSGMVDWLGEHSSLPVRMAQEGDVPAAGVVLLAGSNDHLILKSPGRLGYTAEPADYVYRPSVDVFFHSVRKLWNGRAVGVLLTGMGRDGALGLKALRDKGHHTIAQDRASCTVFGMPKAAIDAGAAIDILSVDRIAASLTSIMSDEIEPR